mgnify:CR=1 FL=1
MNSTTLRWIQPDWPAPLHVHALTTERSASRPEDRHDGFNFADYVQDAPANVVANRQILCKTLGFLHPPVWLSQKHGSTVLKLDHRFGIKSADGSFTTREHTVCAVLSADCAPVFLSDYEGTFVALLHVGWRGLAAGVLEAGIAVAPRTAQEMICWVGPTISQKHFEIGRDVRRQLIKNDPLDERHIVPSGQRYFADLPGLILARLRRMDVAYAEASAECTYAKAGRWFSYRRQGLCGRMASLIWIAR